MSIPDDGRVTWGQQGQGQPPQQPSWAQQPPAGGQQPGPPPGWAAPPPAPPVKKKRGKAGCLGCAGILVVIAVIGIAGAAAGGKKTAASTTVTAPQAGATAPAKPAPAAQTVTYSVTGAADADIQYGPAGSSSQGHAPMDVTQPLDKAAFYSISAQLQGSGTVTCQIKIGGKVISQATANGGYNIASCEIVQDPLNDNKWIDANKG